ncbi:MAG: hypothetical protein V4731_12720 [Pseudomonadota bacterium]
MILEVYEIYPDGVRETVNSMNGRGVAVIMPTTNLAQAVESARRMIAFARYPFRMIIALDTVRGGFVKTLNAVALKLNAEFIVYVAQDALAGDGWLKIAMKNLIENDKSLFAFNDGRFNGGLAQFGAVRMSFCENFYDPGNVFYKGYHTQRADDELTLIAKLSNQLSYSPDALMLEVDYRMQRVINPDDISLYSKRKVEILERRRLEQL